jgi:hypothetical protein
MTMKAQTKDRNDNIDRSALTRGTRGGARAAAKREIKAAVDEDALFLTIAQKYMPNVETLETRNRDSSDFHDVAVWGIKSALKAAYEAGKAAYEAGKAASSETGKAKTKPVKTTRPRKGPLDNLIKVGDKFVARTGIEMIIPGPLREGDMGVVVYVGQDSRPAFCYVDFNGNVIHRWVKELIDVTLFQRVV